MPTVAEAQAVVLQHARPLAPEVVALDARALGTVLAEEIISDIDMPPYDKAMMDGYAVRTVDLPQGVGMLRVIEEVMAGQIPTRSLAAGQATRIMTGAPIPEGTDAVIQVERTRMRDGDQVEINDKSASPGRNILGRAREMRTGEVVADAGTVIRPQVFGLLATVGRTSVRVHPAPQVAILPTGDELVEAPGVPGPGQIRNSNGPMLVAQVSRAGGRPVYLGIAGDRVDSLVPLIEEGLKSPILLLSGGVSAGKLDLVPGVLRDLGVEAHFHKVEMKPGKPVFFGTRAGCLVFGLPGNPVGSLVGFEQFVRPAIRRLMGYTDVLPNWVPTRLAEDFSYATDRPTFYPARLAAGPEGWQVHPVPWFGSADLRALARTNALLHFPAGNHQHRAGQLFPVLNCDGV